MTGVGYDHYEDLNVNRGGGPDLPHSHHHSRWWLRCTAAAVTQGDALVAWIADRETLSVMAAARW